MTKPSEDDEIRVKKTPAAEQELSDEELEGVVGGATAARTKTALTGPFNDQQGGQFTCQESGGSSSGGGSSGEF
jgi:hypothetical protein